MAICNCRLCQVVGAGCVLEDTVIVPMTYQPLNVVAEDSVLRVMCVPPWLYVVISL
jgi:hypothetical protein